nr:glutamine-hydrolyzing GMP synthase [Solobacterium sp.]
MNEMIAIIDFGGQYSQVIARKVRECHVYCEVFSWKTPAEVITEKKPSGIILSGGPSSVYEEGAPTMDPALLNGSVPVLGICYGCQLMMKLCGGVVAAAEENDGREYGRTLTHFKTDCPLFRDLPEEGITWMSHGDYVREIPTGFHSCAETDHCPSAGIWNEEKRLYGLQFHPEVHHTENGSSMLQRFLFDICGVMGDWTMKGFRAEAVTRIRDQVGDSHVLLGLSGGVDSAVCAALIHEAIGDRLICLFIDHGLMRKDEGDEIETC